MPWFNLWERDLTINVKNFTLEKPENTVFKTSDATWDNYYRWTYFIPDIKKLNDQPIKLWFSSLHCKYNLNVKINPNNYQKNIDISYKYSNNFKCLIDIKPDNMKQFVEVQSQQITPNYVISLNDLEVWHYMTAFVFWLFLVVAIWIKYIDKKALLIHNRHK